MTLLATSKGLTAFQRGAVGEDGSVIYPTLWFLHDGKWSEVTTDWGRTFLINPIGVSDGQGNPLFVTQECPNPTAPRVEGDFVTCLNGDARLYVVAPDISGTSSKLVPGPVTQSFGPDGSVVGTDGWYPSQVGFTGERLLIVRQRATSEGQGRLPLEYDTASATFSEPTAENLVGRSFPVKCAAPAVSAFGSGPAPLAGDLDPKSLSSTRLAGGTVQVRSSEAIPVIDSCNQATVLVRGTSADRDAGPVATRIALDLDSGSTRPFKINAAPTQAQSSESGSPASSQATAPPELAAPEAFSTEPLSDGRILVVLASRIDVIDQNAKQLTVTSLDVYPGTVTSAGGVTYAVTADGTIVSISDLKDSSPKGGR